MDYYKNIKDAIKSEYEFDKLLCFIDSFLYNKYILKLTSDEIDSLKNNSIVYESKGKLYYKGHEIVRKD